MNVALAGLTAREETAMVMLIGKTLPDFQCDTVLPGREVPLPLADLYVLDLAGRGLARWSLEAQDHLLQSLNGAPAVLVAPAFDETWTALEASRMTSQSLIILHKPYGIDDMRAALLKTAPRKPRRAAPAAPPAPAAPVAVAVAVRTVAAPKMTAPVFSAPVVRPEVPLPVAAPVEIAPLSLADFQARVGALPTSEPKLFLCKLAEALALQQPFEVRVSLVNRLIVNPDAQWAASNTALPLLQDLCQRDERAAGVSIDAVDRRDAEARAQRMDMPLQPLDAFLGTLVHFRLNRQR
ncbi:MAG: hypothetical protein KA173_01175 [Rhodoferax sp.]|nr:hypothetical protein [Rhodoferax sp.]MBP7493024.1 hypothetical protein [Rhodoferax sp.]